MYRAASGGAPTSDPTAVNPFVVGVAPGHTLSAADAVLFAAFAFAFRGGISYLLSGIALVRGAGRPAGRWTCAAREVAMWAPLVLALVVNIVVQAAHPEWVYVRLAFAMLTVLVLLGYLLIGLRYPNRGPHDELVGTYMVPA